MNNLDRIKSLRAQDYGVAGLSTTDVDWLIAEVERLTAELDRCKAWHDAVMAQPDAGWLCVTPDGSDAQAACREFVRDDYRRFGRVITPMIVRPHPLKENE